MRESRAGGGYLQPQDPHTACTAHLYPSIWLPVLGRPGPDSRDVQSRGTTGLSACLCLAKCKIDPCMRENTSVHRRDEETGREWRLEDVYLTASLSVRLMLPPPPSLSFHSSVHKGMMMATVLSAPTPLILSWLPWPALLLVIQSNGSSKAVLPPDR